MTAISSADFDFVRDLVRSTSGMVLEDGKEYLVESRLRLLARREAEPGFAALVARLRREPAGSALRTAVVEAVLIGETRFFRDVHPFEALREQILPDLIDQGRSHKRLRIWCAAAATGQEPYSLAMLLADFPELATWDVRLIASDLSALMLHRIAEARYSEAEVARGLTPEHRTRWFREDPPGTWTANESLRRRVQVKRINLVEAWPPMPMLDLISLRNVLIYFDEATKRDIIRRAHDQLRPGGYLMLGTSESLPPEREVFEQVRFGQTICYRRLPSARAGS